MVTSRPWPILRLRRIVIIADECFSGGYTRIPDTSSEVIAIALTDTSHRTYCRYFAEAFWGAFLPEADAAADSNHDGSVSVREAFNWAVKAHQAHFPVDKTGFEQYRFNRVGDTSLELD